MTGSRTPPGWRRRGSAAGTASTLTARERHEESLRNFPGVANLFQFVAILTAVVVTVTQWTLPTALVAVGCTSSVIAWHWHFDEFCRLNGVDQLAGMPSPLVVAAAGAGFGVFAVELATGPSGSVIAPGGLEFTLGGMGFCAAWVWWWTQELYDFFDAHAIAA